MSGIIQRSVLLAALAAASAYGGALTLQITKPDQQPEAKALKAAVVAQVTACHEPAKSVLTATAIEAVTLRRVALQVVPLKASGAFAIVGAVPSVGVIEITVTNPEYRDYQPRVLIRSDEHGVQWGSVQRYFSKPPTPADVQALLDAHPAL